MNGSDYVGCLQGLNKLKIKDFFQPDPVLITLYVSVIIISLLANSLLIIVALKCNYTKNVTNVFLINLSVADLLVTCVCMPVQISNAVSLVWFYGETVCKLVNYLQGVAVAASVFTLAAMSVDRWLSISPEPRRRPPNRRQALLLLLLLWTTALLIFLPLYLVATIETELVPVLTKTNPVDSNLTVIELRELSFCSEFWPDPKFRRQFGTFSFALIYVIPGCTTIFSYVLLGRKLCSLRPTVNIYEGNAKKGLRRLTQRKRAAWVLQVLSVVFALCWLPYNIMQLLLDNKALVYNDLSVYIPYALFLGHANSAINPIVYGLMTSKFKKSANIILCGRKQWRRTFITMNTLRYTVSMMTRPQHSGGAQASNKL